MCTHFVKNFRDTFVHNQPSQAKIYQCDKSGRDTTQTSELETLSPLRGQHVD